MWAIADGLRGGRNINSMVGHLKATKLAVTIGDRPVSLALILEVLKHLENEAHARLSDYYGEFKLHLNAADWRESDRYYAHEAVCEDTRLSISAIGQSFVGFLLDANKMPTLSVVQLQLWLDVMASFAVFDDAQVMTKTHRTEYQAICESVQQLAICDRVAHGGDLFELSRL